MTLKKTVILVIYTPYWVVLVQNMNSVDGIASKIQPFFFFLNFELNLVTVTLVIKCTSFGSTLVPSMKPVGGEIAISSYDKLFSFFFFILFFFFYSGYWHTITANQQVRLG